MSSPSRDNPARAVATTLLVVTLAVAPSAVAADGALARRVEASVPAEFSGQVVVGTADGVIYQGRFGMADRERRIPVTDETLFDIGSITKTFTATAVLKLAAADRLAPAQTLGDWFEGLPEATAAVTLHQLLTHTSGLPLYSGDDYDACDRACYDAWLGATPLEFAPGERFHYSNAGYSALARIVEKASGRDYESYLQETLVRPLRLGAVGYRELPPDATVAVGYLDGRRIGRPPELGWLADGPSWHLRGNGGLLASADALCRWLGATAAGRTLPDAWRTRQFHPWAERSEDAAYGYGWVILAKPWGQEIDHTGGNGFFFADARWFRRRGLLLAITNNAFDREAARHLLRDLRDALEPAGPPLTREP